MIIRLEVRSMPMYSHSVFRVFNATKVSKWIRYAIHKMLRGSLLWVCLNSIIYLVDVILNIKMYLLQVLILLNF